MTIEDRDRATVRIWDFRLHWLMLVQPCVTALIGLALYKYGHDFAQSRAGARDVDELLRDLEPALGPNGLRNLRDWAEPASLLVVLLVFGSPLLWALAVRATTILRVDGPQILWQRGVFARRITQVEIGEIVGVNVDESLIGRIFGFGTVDVETRGEDRLFANFIENARGFAGLVLDAKRRARGL
jgi:hypothetical protein